MLYFQYNSLKNIKRTGNVVWWERALATKSDNLSSIPDTHGGKKGLSELFSDRLCCSLTYMHTHTK